MKVRLAAFQAHGEVPPGTEAEGGWAGFPEGTQNSTASLKIAAVVGVLTTGPSAGGSVTMAVTMCSGLCRSLSAPQARPRPRDRATSTGSYRRLLS